MVRKLAVVAYRAVPVLGVVAGVGCAQLAGIDDTNGDARPVDSLTVTRMSVGATVETHPLDLTGLSATYLVARSDASGVDRVVAAPSPDPGTWTTKLYDPVPVQFMLPDLPTPIPRLYPFPNLPTPIPRLYAFPNRRLQVLHVVLEHPNRVVAPDGATFTVTAPLDVAIAATDSFQTYVVGAWLVRPFVAGEFTVGAAQIGPVTYSLTANRISGRPAPDLVTTSDAFLILRYAGAGLTGVAEATPFNQTEMATTVTTGPMVAVTQDQTLDVKIAPNTLLTRYQAVRPAVTTLVMAWDLKAAPGYKIASDAGPSLQSGTLTGVDLGLMVKYGNPFTGRGWNTMFGLTTHESRLYMPPGMMISVELEAGMNQFLESPPAGFSLSLPAGLPILISLDGTPLSTDGQSYKVPSQFARVKFITDAPAGAMTPVATIYDLQVIDLVPNQAGTVIDRHLVLSATSPEATFDLPPELFEVGHNYTLRAIATLGGYPSINDGNFVDRALPLAQGYLDSAVFTVMP